MTREGLILKIDCPDQPGIVAKVAGYVSLHGGNLVEFAQFSDKLNGKFFARLEIDTADADYLVSWVDCIAGGRSLGRGP